MDVRSALEWFVNTVKAYLPNARVSAVDERKATISMEYQGRSFTTQWGSVLRAVTQGDKRSQGLIQKDAEIVRNLFMRRHAAIHVAILKGCPLKPERVDAQVMDATRDDIENMQDILSKFDTGAEHADAETMQRDVEKQHEDAIESDDEPIVVNSSDFEEDEPEEEPAPADPLVDPAPAEEAEGGSQELAFAASKYEEDDEADFISGVEGS